MASGVFLKQNLHTGIIVVAEHIGSSYPTSYGATRERNSEQPRDSIRWNSDVFESEHRQWDLNYREAALYLKVHCLNLLYLG